MAGSRDWFKHDAWFLADDKIRDLGHTFGATGPLVAEALLELAKRQKAAGRVTAQWSYLAEHAFAKSGGQVRRIVADAERLGFVTVEKSDTRDVTVTVVKWQEIQGSGVTGSERTAAWRDRKAANGDVSVTSHTRHGDVSATSPHAGARAVAQEEEKEIEDVANAPSSRRRSATDPITVEREKASGDDRRLCRLQAELMREHNPKAKIKSESAWYRQMRLLRERDRQQPAETEQLLRWTFTAKTKSAMFWANVIQSPGNLREHFGQMWAQMLADGRPKSNGAAVENSAEFLARRGLA